MCSCTIYILSTAAGDLSSCPAFFLKDHQVHGSIVQPLGACHEEFLGIKQGIKKTFV